MAYYVLDDQGNKYGPADVDTLNSWIGEGRILAQTILEDEASGLRIVAATVQGLQFPTATPPPPISNYPRYDVPPQSPPQRPMPPAGYQMTQSQDNGPIFLAIGLAVISPILSLTLPIGGLFTSLWGIRVAIRSKENGHPLAILAIILCGCAIAFWLLTRATGMGRGMFLR